MFPTRRISRRKHDRRRKFRRRQFRRFEALESRRVLATYFVTTDVDNDTGVCVANDASNIGCTIRSAIAAADANGGADTIQIPDGTYVIDSALGSFDVFSDDDLALVGNSGNATAVVIDGTNDSRLFDLRGFGDPLTVSFEGMTLQNGIADDGSGGGAINAGTDVDLSLDLVVIQNNFAAPESLFPSNLSSGGGIQASGNVTIADTIIRDNVATLDGGGIDFSAFPGTKTLTITNSTISGNTTGDAAFDRGYGGGILLRGTDPVASFDGVTISNNSAGDSGGGVYSRFADITVINSNFTGNTALGSDSGGGGLYVLGQGPTSPAFSVTGGTFESNTAVSGAGGFEAVNNSGSIDGTTFQLNQVTGTGLNFSQGGGAITVIVTSALAATPPTITLSNLLVSQNTAPVAAGIASVGVNLTITDSTVSENTAISTELLGAAGGIGVTRIPGTLNPLTVTVERTSILSNSSSGQLGAGGIGALDIDLVITDSTVDGNSALTGRAGGIGVAGRGLGITPLLTADRVTISRNRSGGNGGGVGIEVANLDLTNVTISENQSFSGNGGGIGVVNSGAAGTIRFSTIASNFAPLGSNIAAENSSVDFQGTLFADGTGVAIASTFNSLGNNLDQSGTMGFAGAGDLNGIDPLLAPLANYGGAVETLALRSGSPAIDAGPVAGPAVDARGVNRPVDGNGVADAEFDIGALEGEQGVVLVVDNISDVDDGDFSPGNFTLREAVRVANTNATVTSDTILFDNTVFGVSQTITLAGTQLDLEASVSIVGPGQTLLTISGNDASRIFGIVDSSITVALSGMTMSGGRAIGSAGGGAIFNRATLAITDSTITGSVSVETFAGGYGGGIHNYGPLTLTRSTVSGNTADQEGGGIANYSDLTLIESTISGNTSASNGGGILHYSGTLNVVDSTITGNSSISVDVAVDAEGGGIFNSDTLTVTRSTIDGNTASNTNGSNTARGAGISNRGTLNVTDSTISNNTVIGDSNPSGGIHNSGTAIITTTMILGNLSDAGGGLYNAGNLTVGGSIVSGNTSRGGGGGLFNVSGTSTLNNSTISSNQSLYEGGGGITNFSGTTNITDSTVSGNTSPDGSGGGLHNLSGNVIVTRSVISANQADQNGGGVFNVDTMVVIDSEISGNTATDVGATGYGGGIQNLGTLTLTRSNVINNTAENDGGGISNEGPLTVVDSTVSGNIALSFGGGVAAFSGTADVSNSTISSNSAGDAGGGVFNAGGTIALTRTSISGNTAVDPGGGISNDGDLTLLDSTISGNTTAAAGGGLFNYSGGTLNVTNSTISGNASDSDGGGISNGDGSGPVSTVLINNSTIVGNRSDADGDGTGSGGGVSTFASVNSVTRAFNTIIAGNVMGDVDVESANDIANQDFESDSAFNLVGDPATSGGLTDGILGNIVGSGGSLIPLAAIVNPLLLDNGGLTQTHALVIGSPAIDAGDPAFSPGSFVPSLDFDQRENGFDRVIDGDGDTTLIVDIGAYEFELLAASVLTIRDVNVDEGAGTATVTVTLNIARPSFSVDFTLTNGTAIQPGDFTLPALNTLDFVGLANETQAFTVSIIDDAVTERDETFQVSLSNLVKNDPADPNVDISDTAVVNILDNDIAILTPTLNNVNEDVGAANFTLTLSGTVDQPFTVDLSTFDLPGQAVAGDDYSFNTQTLSFVGFDGETRTFTIAINSDAIVEGDEMYGIDARNISLGGRDIRFQGAPSEVSITSLDQFSPGGIFAAAVDLNVPATTAYVADASGLLVLDITDPDAISQLGAFATVTSAIDVKVVGDLAYLAVGVGGVQVLDVSDPSNIVLLDTFTSAGTAGTIDVVGSTLYIGEGIDGGLGGGLRIVDASDPNDLNELGFFATVASSVDAVFIDGAVAYVALPLDDFRVLDVSNPAAVSELGAFAVGEPFSVEVSDSIAYIGTSTGLRLLDVSNPAAISVVGTFPLSEDVTDVSVDNEVPGVTVVTIVDTSGLLNVIDASDVSNLQSIGSFNTLSLPLRFATDNDVTFVADGNGGLRSLRSESALLSAQAILNDDTATLTVSDVSVDEGAGTAAVTVTLDHEVQGGFTYSFTTNDGTASAPGDYTTTTGNFATGSAGQQQTIVIPIIADAVNEADESFTVSLFGLDTTGSVSASSIDASDTGTVTITESPIADLSITISDSADPILAGNALSYTLVVTNNGPSSATSVQVVNTLPNDVQFVSGDINGDSSGVSEDVGIVTAVIGNLAVGATSTITINVNVNAAANGVLTNAAVVSGAEIDSNLPNNSAIESTTLEQIDVADDTVNLLEDAAATTLDVLANDTAGTSGALTITTVTAASIGVVSVTAGGATLTYTPNADTFGQDIFSYTVLSPLGQTATANVTVNVASVNDPPVATDDSFTAPDRGPFPIATNLLLQNDSTGPANELQTASVVSVSATSAGGGSVSLAGSTVTYTPLATFIGLVDTFTYTMTDGIDNRSATVTVNLPPISNVDLTTSISDDVDPVIAQQSFVTFTIPIRNGGTDTATNVVSTTVIPNEFSVISATISPSGTVSTIGNTVTATLASLDSSDTVTLTIIANPSSTRGTFTTSTSVVSDVVDGNAADNSDSETTTVLVATTVSGHVYCDINGNGQEDQLEEVRDATVFLDLNGNRILDSGELRTITDFDGDYRFTNVIDPALTVVVEVPFVCDTIPFNPGVARSTIGVGDLARSITSVDIDNDGDRDLLVASDGSNSLAVLVNDGGEFSLAQEIILADRPQSVSAWESSNSVTPLIAVAAIGTPDNGGSVFTLNGSISTIEGGNGPIDVVIDDFDRNGQPDILFGTFRSSELQLLLNDAAEPVAIATARLVRTVASGDVNGDGNSDILLGGYGYPGDETSELLVLLGDGEGGFADPVTTSPIQKLVSIQVVNLSDIREENETRILALSEAGQMNVYQFIGEALVLVDSVDLNPGSTSFDVGDFNRDGLTDLAIANLGMQQIDLLIGNGLGQFAPVTTLSNVPAPSDIVVDDFDNDGQKDDIAVANLYQDANLGQPGTPDFFLPSATTILRLDVAEEVVVLQGGGVSVDFVFQSADPDIRFDVSGDGVVTALDALRVINAMERSAEGEQVSSHLRQATDVNGDGRTSAVDALMIINYLIDQPAETLPLADIDLRIQDDDDDDRIAAVDVVLTHLLS